MLARKACREAIMPVRDASSSPTVLRIVDVIPTSESGNVAQNSELQRHRSTHCCEDDGGMVPPADAGTVLRPDRATGRFRDEERKLISGSAREGTRSPFAALLGRGCHDRELRER